MTERELIDPDAHDAIVATARAHERLDILNELEMRCHALRHPQPCPWCGPILHIVRGELP